MIWEDEYFGSDLGRLEFASSWAFVSQGFPWMTDFQFQLQFAENPPKSHLPIESMAVILTYIYHKSQPNVGKYTSPMDSVGLGRTETRHPSCSVVISAKVVLWTSVIFKMKRCRREPPNHPFFLPKVSGADPDCFSKQCEKEGWNLEFEMDVF